MIRASSRSRGSLLAAVFLSICSLLATSEAVAQIVNVLPNLKVEVDEGVTGVLLQDFAWKTGNNESLLFGAQGILRARGGDHYYLFMMSGRYMSSGGEPFDSQTMEHTRYRWDFAKPLGGEVFGQHEYNELRRLRARALLGAGPRLGFEAGETFAVAIGTAYMFEYERLDLGRDEDEVPFADRGEKTWQHRWSSYLSFNFMVFDVLQITQTTYIQPRFDDFSDFKFLADLTVTVPIKSGFAFNLSGSISHDTAPPLGVEKTDTSLINSLSYEFGPI